MPTTDRRAIRIIYPPHLAPEVFLDGVTYHVVDLSPGGCLLGETVPPRYHVGQNVTGLLRFKDGAVISVDAIVLRAHDSGFALEFQRDLPMAYIERETEIFGGQERDRRRFFRLRYSQMPNPRLICTEKEIYRVLEISEAAIVFYCDDFSRFIKGAKVKGGLAFHDGESIPVDGYIFRMTADCVIVLLSRFLPAARMMKEQQYAVKLSRQA